MNIYPGVGRPLYLSLDPAAWPAGNKEVIAQPPVAAIPNASYSDSEAVADGQQVFIQIKYAVAPGSATTIQYGSDPRLLDAITLDTIPSSSDTLAVWTNITRLNGFIRVNNTSGQTINEVLVQKQVKA